MEFWYRFEPVKSRNAYEFDFVLDRRFVNDSLQNDLGGIEAIFRQELENASILGIGNPGFECKFGKRTGLLYSLTSKLGFGIKLHGRGVNSEILVYRSEGCNESVKRLAIELAFLSWARLIERFHK